MALKHIGLSPPDISDTGPVVHSKLYYTLLSLVFRVMWRNFYVFSLDFALLLSLYDSVFLKGMHPVINKLYYLKLYFNILKYILVYYNKLSKQK